MKKPSAPVIAVAIGATLLVAAVVAGQLPPLGSAAIEPESVQDAMMADADEMSWEESDDKSSPADEGEPDDTTPDTTPEPSNASAESESDAGYVDAAPFFFDPPVYAALQPPDTDEYENSEPADDEDEDADDEDAQDDDIQDASGNESPYGKTVSANLSDANAAQRRLVIEAYNTPTSSAESSAAWVEKVYANAGFGTFYGEASELYDAYCHSSDPSRLQVGMIVAVSTHPHSSEGSMWGHVGIYVGDNIVCDSVQGQMRTSSLKDWIDYYGSSVPVKWGWLGNVNIA